MESEAAIAMGIAQRVEVEVEVEVEKNNTDRPEIRWINWYLQEIA